MSETNYIEERLGKSWYPLLKDEFGKTYMNKIRFFLIQERKRTTIYPDPGEIFNVYKDTPFDSIKVVILGRDPYHGGEYDGKAFSNREGTLRVSPSLRNILKEVERDVYDGLRIDQPIDLSRWQKQGVFLLNSSLTVEAGKPGSHSNIGWQNFTAKTIKLLAQDKKPKVFMLWGNYAQKVFDAIGYSSNHLLVLRSSHPSPLGFDKTNNPFKGCGHFSKANEFLKQNGIKEIEW